MTQQLSTAQHWSCVDATGSKWGKYFWWVYIPLYSSVGYQLHSDLWFLFLLLKNFFPYLGNNTCETVLYLVHKHLVSAVRVWRPPVALLLCNFAWVFFFSPQPHLPVNDNKEPLICRLLWWSHVKGWSYSLAYVQNKLSWIDVCS